MTEFQKVPAPSGGADTRVPIFESVEQIVKVSLDAVELPPLFEATITRISNETIVGESTKEVVELFSDAVFQDGLRTIAAEFVNEFLSKSLNVSQIKAAIDRYSTKFLESPPGQRLAG